MDMLARTVRHIQVQLGKDLLLSSFMWLLAGFSSSQGVGLRASVLGTNDIMAACSIRLSKEETSVSMKARVRAREGLSRKVKSFITEIFM